MKKLILLLSFSFISFTLAFSQVSMGEQAREIVPGAEKVWEKPHLLIPAYVRYEATRTIPRNQFSTYLQEVFHLNGKGYGLQILRSENDQLGQVHERFVQTYRGIPVEGSMLIVHSKNSQIIALNGEIYPVEGTATQPSVSESSALASALRYVNAESYMWEGVQPAPGSPHDAYSLPEGQLVIVPVEGDYKSGSFRLAWKFDIYAREPLGRKHIFVDALNGQVIFELEQLHSADAQGTAVTRYSGTQSIVTDSTGTGFRLREQGRGNGIETYDALNNASYGAAVDITDSDNYWDNFPSAVKRAGVDAHWGAEMTYDYLLQEHGRNSIDDNGFRLRNYVHWGSPSVFNAFWNGQAAHFYDANGTPLTSLDVVSHEISHGLTGNTADLVYRNEPGALNESFSDIFGKAVEYFANSNGFSWRIGNAVGRPFRDMANPLAFNNPRNYLGNRWYTGSGDNGGVHINSGVQNHWFYLLVQGGTGSNDFGESYDVDPIGWDSAAAVAFRNLTVYLTPNSEYEDARFYGIQSAIDLYGTCGKAHREVTDAWHAVGLGRPFSPNPVVDFAATTLETCSFPYQIEFRNLSAGVASQVWDFGDGTTSTLPNPVHTYTAPGTYTISLGAVGICGGAASETKSNYVTINQAPRGPAVVGDVVDCQQAATLIAQDSNQNPVYWYNVNNELLGMGDTLVTPPQGSSTIYYAVSVDLPASQFAGLSDNQGGTGGILNTDIRYLVFDVLQPAVLKSVKVYAQGAGYRLIEYRNANGLVLASKLAYLPDGESRVSLNFELEVGADHELAVVGRTGMYANNSNLSYPYDLPGILSIKGTNDVNPTQFYVFFYDWEVHLPGCSSKPVPVPVSVNPINGPVVADETRCGPGTVTFIASQYDSSLYWYDANGNFLSRGSSFTTDPLATTTTFSVENVRWSSAQSLGIPGNANNTRYLTDPFDQHLAFTVFQSLRLRSVWVNADSAYDREIILSDAIGAPLDTFKVYLPAGPSRLELDLELTPGSYRLGGINLGLTYNATGATFPYEIPGVISLDRSSNGLTSYYYFYDWEVQESICRSAPVTVTATVTPGPDAVFSYTQAASTFNFTDLSSGANSWNWDFGDGNSSTLQNPVHTYTAAGTYTVTLTTSDGNCQNSSNETVVVDQVTSLEDLLLPDRLLLYPNPGEGRFSLEAELGETRRVKVQVFNLMGQEVYRSEPQLTDHFTEVIDLGPLGKGVYLVSLEVEDERVMKRYIFR